MVIECPYCEAVVSCRQIGEHVSYHPEEDPGPFTVGLLECPSCKQTLVGGYYTYHEGAEQVVDKPSRLWPVPPRQSDWSIPGIVRDSLDEADKCYRAGAYSACAVMCGRTLEGVCRHFGAGNTTLGPGLRELRDKQVIDGRLFEWATELQKSRNLNAHASGERVSKPDARDLLEFTRAICEFVFVLSEKFNSFKERQGKKAQKKHKVSSTALASAEATGSNGAT